MILGQLWYGWAPRGLEGVNQEQLVAASGKLGSRADSITQKVLPWCYALKSDSRGWIEQNGVGVAFRRTPTGRDAHGRGGAFFVHALIWESGAMPAALLSGLWDADVWVSRPPEELPERLELIRDPESLGLGVAEAVDFGVMLVTLAGLLENIVGLRKSRIELPPGDAYSVASTLVAVLPVRFGLLSFSTYEERDRATAYDIVAGPATGPQHMPVGPGQEPAEAWLGASRLLLSASHGDKDAMTLVELIGADAATLRDFVDRVRRWAELETGSLQPGRDLDSQTVALLTKSPELVSRLIQGKQAKAIAQSLIAGSQVDRLLDALRRSGQAETFIGVVQEALSTEAPPVAVQCLSRLERWFPSEAHALAVVLTDSWPAGSTRRLSPAEATALAGWLANANRPQGPRLARTVDELTSVPEFAASLVAATSLPSEWRAISAAGHPEQIPAQVLATAIVQDHSFARAFVTRSGNAGIQRIKLVIESVDVGLARACAETAGACLGSGEDHLRLVWPIIVKASPREQLDLLDRYSRLRIDFDENWMNIAITALVEEVLIVRERYDAIPAAGRPAFGVNLSSSTTRIEEWRRLSQTLRRSGPFQVAQAMRAVAALRDQREVDAALEIVVDAACERFDHSGEGWYAAVATISSGTGDTADGFALRLARAATRRGRGDRATVAQWVIRWVADGIDEKKISRDFSRDPVVIALANQLRYGGVEAIGCYAAERDRRPASRRWLRDVEKKARKNFPRRRWFNRSG